MRRHILTLVFLVLLLLPSVPSGSSSSGGGGDDSGGGGGPDLIEPPRGSRISLADLRDLYHRDLVKADALCWAFAMVQQPDWPHPADVQVLTRLFAEQHIQCPARARP